MAEPSGPFGVLRDGADRYLCYCRPASGPGSAATVYVTDALEMWAARLGGDSPEDGFAELRAALGRGAVSLGLRDGAATLRLREGQEALQLPRLPAAEARPQLQALLFAMAARVRDLEERLEVLGTLSYSPEKNALQSQQPILPGALRAQKGLQGCQSPPLTSCFPCPSSRLRQTRAPERTGLVALLCQQRERSRESPSLTLASKASLFHLEWTLKTHDLRCSILPTAALSSTCGH